jgi:hypothetical protein
MGMKKLFVKQNMALQKFSKETGENRRNSKYVYAISSIQAQIFQIKKLVKVMLNSTDALLQAGCKVRN